MSSVTCILSWKFGWHNKGSRVKCKNFCSIKESRQFEKNHQEKIRYPWCFAHTITCKKEIRKAFLGFGLLRLNWRIPIWELQNFSLHTFKDNRNRIGTICIVWKCWNALFIYLGKRNTYKWTQPTQGITWFSIGFTGQC